MSAGLDSSLRAFSIFSERLNRNLGTASHNRKLSKKKGVRKDPNKMKPIVDFTAGIDWNHLIRRLNRFI